jgi:hypothetical protein
MGSQLHDPTRSVNLKPFAELCATVCRQWRQLILNQPPACQLWVLPVFLSEIAHPSDESPEANMDPCAKIALLLDRLTRSRGADLEVHIRTLKVYSFNITAPFRKRETLERLFVHFLFLLTPYKNQISTLYLGLSDMTQVPISIILQNMGHLPRLECLTLPGDQSESTYPQWVSGLRGTLSHPLRLSLAHRLSYLSVHHILYLQQLELPKTLLELSCEYGRPD